MAEEKKRMTHMTRLASVRAKQGEVLAKSLNAINRLERVERRLRLIEEKLIELSSLNSQKQLPMIGGISMLKSEADQVKKPRYIDTPANVLDKPEPKPKAKPKAKAKPKTEEKK